MPQPAVDKALASKPALDDLDEMARLLSESDKAKTWPSLAREVDFAIRKFLAVQGPKITYETILAICEREGLL